MRCKNAPTGNHKPIVQNDFKMIQWGSPNWITNCESDSMLSIMLAKDSTLAGWGYGVTVSTHSHIC